MAKSKKVNDQKTRKVGFYYLNINQKNRNAFEEFKRTIIHINNLARTKKKNNISQTRFTYLNSIDEFEDGTKFQIVFNSATHSYRARLIHKDTLKERPNPKTMKEGEKNSTHIIVKYSSNRLIIFLEEYQDGLSIKQLINYLNYYSKLFYKESPVLFNHELILKDDFLEEVRSMKRVTLGEISIDKEILGSSFLNLTDNTRTVQKEVVLLIKTKRSDTIVETVRDIFSTANSGKNIVREIRVSGKDHDGYPVKFNTGHIAKIKHLDTKIDITTGEIISDVIFKKMNQITSEYL